MKKKTITYRGAIRPAEVNGTQQMKLQFFVDRFEQSGRNFSGLIGLNRTFLTELNAGIAVVEHNIKIDGLILEDDLIYIEAHVVDIADKVFTVKHIIKDGQTDEIKSSAIIKTLMFDLSKRKAISLPDLIRTNLQKMQ